MFQRASAAPTHFGDVQIHGGKDNTVEANLFVDAGAAVSFSAWGDKRWRKFVAESLDDPAIDKDLYLERYPLLARLEEDHDAALVRDNVLVRCDAMFLREHKAVEAADNREYPESDAFMTDKSERLTWSATEAEELGVAHIPFDQIGLYKDAWRSPDK